MINIFIPSYKRANNIKTLKYFAKIGYEVDKLHVIIDSEADDKIEYEEVCKKYGCNLHIFDIDESRERYDYVHRPSVSRRAAGQARNMFYDIAKKLNIDFFIIQDDDTSGYQIKKFGKYIKVAKLDDINNTFLAVKNFMNKRKIGLFGIPQTGDFIGGTYKSLLINKVMNTTFIDMRFIYRGERGVQDNDTSQFINVMNEGYFTGSLGDGLVLSQTQSAKQKGGLTDLYKENKLLNKALITPIQFPSAIYANKQEQNGGRLHHSIVSKHLYPRLIKSINGDENISWDRYEEDGIFTCEPKRRKSW